MKLERLSPIPGRRRSHRRRSVVRRYARRPCFCCLQRGHAELPQVDAGHQKVQDQLNDAETSGQCAGPDGFCDDSIPGSDVEPQEGAAKPATKPVTIHAPILAK